MRKNIFIRWFLKGADAQPCWQMIVLTADGWQSFISTTEGLWENEGFLPENKIPTQEELDKFWSKA